MVDQIDMWTEPRRLARTTDPWTSHAAAERVQEFRKSHQQRIIEALRFFGPMTVCEMERATGIPQHAIGKRIRELVDSGQIAITGKTRPSSSGRQERVLDIATP